MPIAPDVHLGSGVVIPHPELVNLYGCSIGESTSIGPFVEIQKGVLVGARCRPAPRGVLPDPNRDGRQPSRIEQFWRTAGSLFGRV